MALAFRHVERHVGVAFHSRCLIFCAYSVLGASAVSAEDITLTTYLPPPKGRYEELRTIQNTALAVEAGGVGIGTEALEGGTLLTVRTRSQAEVVGLLPGEGAALRVGIGTASPQALLEIHGADQATSLALFLPGAGGQLRLGIGTATPNAQLEIHGADALAMSAALTVTSASGASSLTVHNDSTVGVGAAHPAGRLAVQGVGRDAGTAALDARVPSALPTGTSVFIVRDDGNVGIENEHPTQEAIPQASPKNHQATGNLDANDVWLRSISAWAGGLGGSPTFTTCPDDPGLPPTESGWNLWTSDQTKERAQLLGQHTFCAVTGYTASATRLQGTVFTLYRDGSQVPPMWWLKLNAMDDVTPSQAMAGVKTVCLDWGQQPSSSCARGVVSYHRLADELITWNEVLGYGLSAAQLAELQSLPPADLMTGNKVCQGQSMHDSHQLALCIGVYGHVAWDCNTVIPATDSAMCAKFTYDPVH